MKSDDVANVLGIKSSTLRKYALLFETNGYVFDRNSQYSRIYTQQDVKLLNDFCNFRKGNSKITNEEILTMLEYDFKTQLIINNGAINDNQQGLKKTEETEVLKLEINKLDKKIDDLNTLLLNIADNLSKDKEAVQIDEITPAKTEEKIKKKGIWNLIMSRD